MISTSINSSITFVSKYVCIAKDLYIRLYVYNFYLSFFSDWQHGWRLSETPSQTFTFFFLSLFHSEFLFDAQCLSLSRFLGCFLNFRRSEPQCSSKKSVYKVMNITAFTSQPIRLEAREYSEPVKHLEWSVFQR